MGERKDSFLVGKPQYLEQGRVFGEDPSIFTKVVDASTTGVTTARYHGTDEKIALWHGLPIVPDHFTPVHY